MIKLTQLLITGATVGLIYGLMAVGFVLIYKASKIFNFAQGEMVMVGAFLAWTFLGLFNLPLIVGLPLACIITAAVGYSLERFPFRPMIGQPILATIMITMAIAVFLRGLAILLWANHIGISFPSIIAERTIDLGGIPVSNVVLWNFFFVFILVSVLGIFFHHTRMGLHMRAAAESHRLAQSMGIRVTQAVAQSWAIAAAVATIGGFLLGHIRGIDFGLAETGLIAIAAALVGGLESFRGAIAGGLIIGLAEALTGGYIGRGLKEVIPYAIMVGVLFYRPYGLFGLKKIERV